MPYIKPHRRDFLGPSLSRLGQSLLDIDFTKGDLNYCITMLVIAYIHLHGKRYSTLSDVTGVLNDVKVEFERRVVAPYEDRKKADNGDVGYDDL